MVMIGMTGGTIIKGKVLIPRIKRVRPLSACCRIAVTGVIVVIIMVSGCILTMTVLAIDIAGATVERALAWMMQPTPYLR